MLRPATGVTFRLVDSGNGRATAGRSSSKRQPLPATSKEAYRLNVTPDRITITGDSPAGVFYGMQTLRQLLPAQIFATSVQNGVRVEIPCVEIVDQPRFAWRGFMLDDSRHFQGGEYVKRLIDLTAIHKLNLLHWHLSDNNGFRIEIKSYPKLTEIGGWRGTQCKLPNTQHGETFDRYGGFYTQEQIRDIVAYAAARHINIMPEIDMPGHSGTAAAAYPEILCEGKHTGHVSCAGPRRELQNARRRGGRAGRALPVRVHPRRRRRSAIPHLGRLPPLRGPDETPEVHLAGPTPRLLHPPL